MRSRFRGLFGAAVVCVLLAGCSRTPNTAQAAGMKAVQDRREAPDFALKDANGTTVHLSDYKGKVILLDFWATWCGPCKIEIPWFMEFEQQYKSRGFAVLGVSMDEGGWEDVKPYIEERKINYRILMGDDHIEEAYGKILGYLKKAADEKAPEEGIDALPTTFLIDRSGRVATVHVGIEKGKNEISEEIDHLLQGERAARSSVFFTAPAFITRAK